MTLPPGWRLEVHEALASTSDRVAAAAEAGAPAGLAVLARRQTAGRGRSGRAWASPDGNLFCTLLLRPPGPVGVLCAVLLGLSLWPWAAQVGVTMRALGSDARHAVNKVSTSSWAGGTRPAP